MNIILRLGHYPVEVLSLRNLHLEATVLETALQTYLIHLIFKHLKKKVGNNPYGYNSIQQYPNKMTMCTSYNISLLID